MVSGIHQGPEADKGGTLLYIYKSITQLKKYKIAFGCYKATRNFWNKEHIWSCLKRKTTSKVWQGEVQLIQNVGANSRELQLWNWQEPGTGACGQLDRVTLRSCDRNIYTGQNLLQLSFLGSSDNKQRYLLLGMGTEHGDLGNKMNTESQMPGDTRKNWKHPCQEASKWHALASKYIITGFSWLEKKSWLSDKSSIRKPQMKWRSLSLAELLLWNQNQGEELGEAATDSVWPGETSGVCHVSMSLILSEACCWVRPKIHVILLSWSNLCVLSLKPDNSSRLSEEETGKQLMSGRPGFQNAFLAWNCCLETLRSRSRSA